MNTLIAHLCVLSCVVTVELCAAPSRAASCVGGLPSRTQRALADFTGNQESLLISTEINR